MLDTYSYESYEDMQIGKLIRDRGHASNPLDQEYRDAEDMALGKAVREKDIEKIKKQLGDR